MENFLIDIFVHLYHGRKYLYQLANFVLPSKSKTKIPIIPIICIRHLTCYNKARYNKC